MRSHNDQVATAVLAGIDDAFGRILLLHVTGRAGQAHLLRQLRDRGKCARGTMRGGAGVFLVESLGRCIVSHCPVWLRDYDRSYAWPEELAQFKTVRGSPLCPFLTIRCAQNVLEHRHLLELALANEHLVSMRLRSH